MGVTFGGGSNTVFGSSGAGDLLTKVTTGLAVAFMVTSILLVKQYSSQDVLLATGKSNVLEGSVLDTEQAVESPPAETDASTEAGEVSSEEVAGGVGNDVEVDSTTATAAVDPPAAPAQDSQESVDTVAAAE